MSYEAADQWLDCIDLDWIEEDDPIEALLRDFTLEDEVSEASAGGTAPWWRLLTRLKDAATVRVLERLTLTRLDSREIGPRDPMDVLVTFRCRNVIENTEQSASQSGDYLAESKKLVSVVRVAPASQRRFEGVLHRSLLIGSRAHVKRPSFE
jgi:hypothetical protein